jgi:hypothetical protein
MGQEVYQAVWFKPPLAPPQFLFDVPVDLGQHLLAVLRRGLGQFSGVFLQRGFAEVVLQNLQRLTSRNNGPLFHVR